MDKKFEVFKKYKECITNLLSNVVELDVDEEDINQLAQRLLEAENVVSGKDYNMPDEFLFISGKTLVSNKIEIIKTIKQISKNIEDILLIIIVDSIAEKVEMDGITKKLAPKITVKTIYTQLSKKDSHFIAIDTRLNSMMFEGNSDNAVYPEGQIFIAKLYDLILLYYEMGDSLFEKNVRYSISSDKNGVDAAIHETLDKEPENFWFYNNGITILADKIDCFDTNTIRIYSSPENSFSVINGAQTITASANYFFKPRIPNESLANAKKASVLLRVITVHEKEENPSDDKRKIESKISVSLNRQKPIDFEDLAFNSNLVRSINNITTDSVIDFTICRKGDQEISNTEPTYLLSEVARFVMASKLQIPGRAKNMYKGSILRMEGDSFKKRDILTEIDENNSKKSFISQYGLVNLSNKLFESFSNCKEMGNDLTEEQKKNFGQLFENGHYYFVALVIRVLFIDSIGDTEEKINIDRIKKVDKNLGKEKLKELADLYKSLVISAVDKVVEYSDIKKDALYFDIIETSAYEVFRSKAIKLVFSPEDVNELTTKNI